MRKEYRLSDISRLAGWFKACLFLTVGLSMSSCLKDDMGLGVATDKTVVKFRMNVPSNTVVSDWTRASQEDERTVNNLSIFVADADGIYRGRYVPTRIWPERENHTIWTGEAELPVVDSKVTLHFIVNFNDMLPADIDSPDYIGKKLSEVIPSLTDTRPDPNAEDYHSFTMWGFVDRPNGLSAENTEPVEVRVIRNVSSVKIEFAPEVLNAGMFDFEQLILYNVRMAGTVAPYPFPVDMEPATLMNAESATEPSTGDIGVYYGKKDVQEIYCYSRQNRTWTPALGRDSCMFVIMKGKYKDRDSSVPDKECYYRIELAMREGTWQNPTFKAEEIFRNRLYNVYVDEISGPGYPTIEEAIKYPSSNNINTVLTATPVEDITDLISNGQYKVGLSRGYVSLYGEPVEADTDWFEVCKVYGVAPLVDPDDITVGVLPTLDDLVCTIRDNSDGLILPESWTEGADGKLHLKTEFHNADIVTSSYKSILIKRAACPPQGKRTATIDVRVGNLERTVTITQSYNRDFDIPTTIYVGWKSGLETFIPVRLPAGSAAVSDLTCNISIESASTGFLKHKDGVKTVTLRNENDEVNAVLLTTSSYYAKTTDFYREQKVVISADGFNPATVTVKQSKFLDGIYGSAIVGIMRGNTETEIYTTSFGNSEERWSAKVVQGADFIRLGVAGSGIAEMTELGSNTTGNIGFDYRLLENTGPVRYGKIELTYAKEQWTHNIYVCQGMDDVEVTYNGKTTVWAAGNTVYHADERLGLYVSKSTSYGGAMFKLGDMTYTPYNPVSPTWGQNYTPIDQVYTAGWSQVSGDRANYAKWNPCPEGYRLPTADEFSVWAVKLDGDFAGMDEVEGKPYKKVVWGRVSNGDNTMLRPGMLYIFLDNAGNVTKMFFLAAAGIRSETFGRSQGIPNGNGKLVYGHYRDIPGDPENNFGNQGGGYWYQLASIPGPQNVPFVDLYHDPENNIGLSVVNAGGASWWTVSASDAMPVRCVRR